MNDSNVSATIYFNLNINLRYVSEIPKKTTNISRFDLKRIRFKYIRRREMLLMNLNRYIQIQECRTASREHESLIIRELFVIFHEFWDKKNSEKTFSILHLKIFSPSDIHSMRELRVAPTPSFNCRNIFIQNKYLVNRNKFKIQTSISIFRMNDE